ncbi:class I SAM-dependent methyltransferase [Methanobacterium alkalithermotolerans]|uniref:class I SAM-dependent methyltransferase n=1 Tax=Methanobacterium alkalithermotolerans TaxID=2731220 RepID=UPI002013477D|nr:class I SAM-dependent methyltransferase [Methanobacterium alkalithermotolerans]
MQSSENSLEKIKKHFDDEAEEYDKLILTLIPHYHEMIDALILSIPFAPEYDIKVLDLGCGTGNISKKVKERFPQAHITCVDMAEKMIHMAKNKLSKYSDISYVLSDFQNLKIEEEYQVIISSLALHHLENNQAKIDFYKVIYQSLVRGGAFYNADVVLGSTDYLQNLYLEKWKEFMAKNYSEEEIENKWLPVYRQEDKPVEMRCHIEWLKECGFKKVDVLWKYYNYGVFGGLK